MEDETKMLVLQKMLGSKLLLKWPESISLSHLSVPDEMGATFQCSDALRSEEYPWPTSTGTRGKGSGFQS